MSSDKPRSKRKRLTAVLCVFLAAGILGALTAAGINLYMLSFARGYIITPEEAAGRGADCVLVLGAKVWSDDVLSHMLEDRMSRGIELYLSGAGEKLLLSGDHGSYGYDEVNSMKKYALDREVPAQDIFLDHAGFCTYDSMYRARDVFTADTVVVVTQRYHLYRAVYLARKLGLDAVGVSSDLREYGSPLYNNGREFLARLKAFAMAIFNPEPTYLGEVIPISGDGEATNG